MTEQLRAGDSRYCDLPIDTRVFGHAVARIIPESLEPGQLGDILDELKRMGVRLAFWGAGDGSAALHRAAADRGGYLAARNVRFAMKLNRRTVPGRTLPPGVIPRADGVSETELVSLAMEAGRTSRYCRDPRIGPAGADRLYREWMRHAMADRRGCRVFTLRRSAVVAGMGVATSTPDHAVIMLLAVNETLRGQGAGSDLVRGIQRYYRDVNVPSLNVVTPADNLPACRLYESCGFRRDATLAMYHFWL